MMRIIIAGAGPSGLVLAHALLRVGIDDFVLLERNEEAVEESGAALGLWPHGTRILDQLGLYDAVRQISVAMDKSFSWDSSGKLLYQGSLFRRMTENHGHEVIVLERMRFVQLLYDALPDNKTRVLTGKTVQDVAQDLNRVTVTCADGSSYTGTILIGADGVHSAVRTLTLPSLAGPTSCPFPATYQCLFGSSPRPKPFPAGSMIETHNRGFSFHILALHDVACWFVFLRRPAGPTSDRRHYCAGAAADVAARFAAHPICREGAVTFGDLWATRRRAQLVDLQEGVLDTWHAGRVVLLGDAVHKMTPNLAFGANTAMESAVALVNELRRMQGVSGAEGQMSTGDCEAAFSAYQARREERTRQCVTFSGQYTRFAAWNNWGWELFGRWVMPIVGSNPAVDFKFAPIAKGGEILDLVREDHWREGRVRWVNQGSRHKED